MLIHWAQKCVLHVLPLLEDTVDKRLTFALETAEAWAQGKVPVGAAMQAAYQCHAAARDAVTPPVTLVTRAVGQMVATAHMADHSLGAAWYVLKAVNAVGRSVECGEGRTLRSRVHRRSATTGRHELVSQLLERSARPR